eukprot:EG_transcript_13218
MLRGLLVAVLLAGLHAALSPTDPGWGDLAAAVEGGSAPARAALSLLANATYLSYTATHGSYYDPRDANATIAPDWVKEPLGADPPGGGMRALYFTHRHSRRAILAFRGTDLGDPLAPGPLADRCADDLLWNGVPWERLPAACHRFPAATLDYFRAAVAFAWEAARQFPGRDVALTGHSLGAGLALLVAAAAGDCAPPSAGAVGFAAPPVVPALRNRTATNPAAGPPSRLVAFADTADPVLYAVNATDGFQGTLCLWGGPIPAACRQCYAGHPTSIDLKRPPCLECFLQRHVYHHYYHDLVPGAPATCERRTPCPTLSSCPPRGRCTG